MGSGCFLGVDRAAAADDLPALLAAIRVAAGSQRVVVLIDGRSGAGKSELATVLSGALDAQLVRLDELYPGWEGLEAGSAAVHETVLRPREPGWTGWDWTSARAAGWHPLDSERPVIVEGCGALSRANRALAIFGIWLEVDAVERHRRVTARDGGRFDAYWDSWAAQEDAFIAREHPRQLADVVRPG